MKDLRPVDITAHNDDSAFLILFYQVQNLPFGWLTHILNIGHVSLWEHMDTRAN